jgi:streptogramin lyase
VRLWLLRRISTRTPPPDTSHERFKNTIAERKRTDPVRSPPPDLVGPLARTEGVARVLLVVVVLVVCATVTVVVATVAQADGGSPISLAVGFGRVWARTGGGVVALDANTNRVACSVAAETGDDLLFVHTLTVGSDHVWAAGYGRLTRINPRTCRREGAPIAVGRSPLSITVGRGAVWVVNVRRSTIVRVEITTGAVKRFVYPGHRLWDISVGNGSVWASSFAPGNGSVLRINPRTGALLGAPIPVGQTPMPLTNGAGAVWVGNADDKTVTRIDPRTGARSTFPVRITPFTLVADARAVWAGDNQGLVVRIDPRTRQVQGDPIRVGTGDLSLALGGKWLWAGDARRGTLRRIDVATGRPAGKPIPVPPQRP